MRAPKPEQFGFTPGKKTKHAIKFVYYNIKLNRTAKMDTVLMMLDVKGPFNNLSWKSIFQASAVPGIFSI